MAVDQRTFIPGAVGTPLLPEQPIPTERQQRLLRDGVPPPSALWVDANDILELRTRNSQAAIALTVSARLMEPDGRIITPQFVQSPTGDRTINSSTQPLYEGYLLAAAVTSTGATIPRRGQTFCQLRVNRMPAPSNLTHYVLGADYVTSNQPIEWPYGRITNPVEGPGWMESVSIANPAAGADWTLTLGGQERARIRGASAQLVTAVAAGVRQVAIIVDDGTNTIYTIESASTQGPSLTQIYNLIPGDTLTTLTATQQPIYIPPDLILGPAFRIRSSTGTIQAADQWSAIRFFLEDWIED